MEKLIAANWKMHMTGGEAESAAAKLATLLGEAAPSGRKLLFFPPFTCLERTAAAVAAVKGASCGAQNCYPAEKGAFTGEISPAMIKACGAEWVLAGHSERRHILGEHNNFIAEKCLFALESGLKVMLCIGETLEERERGELEATLTKQLVAVLDRAAPVINAQDLAVAYEPVWAIGTGRSAGPEDITEAHALIRAVLKNSLPEGNEIAILYGGSVKPENAGSILNLDNVGGLLVGSSSLQAESFARIAQA